MLTIKTLRAALVAASALTLVPTLAHACACGCGVFTVGAGNLMADDAKGSVFIEYDFMNQSRNWHGGTSATADDNADKKIRTDFYTVGGQYRLNMNWTMSADVPVWNRSFTTDDGEGPTTANHTAFGDARLKATWTGLSKDMGTGLVVGVKLPTGDHSFAGFDPDTQISSGSTDLILGAYRQGPLNRDNTFRYFVQGQWEKPVDWRSNYRPGEELNVSAGVSWAGWTFAGDKATLAPVIQLIGSVRARDHGPDANPGDSGYERLVLSTGLELQANNWRLFTGVGAPVYQRVNGNQLIAPVLFKAMLTRSF